MQADANYTINPWMQRLPVQVQRPWGSYEDQMTGEALATVMSMPADEIRNIRPPIPINPFPPRFGYRVGAIGIRDIVSLDDMYTRRDFTGKQSGFGSTSYPSLNQF